MYSLLAPIVSLVGAAEGGPITIFVQRSMGNRYPLARIFSSAVCRSSRCDVEGSAHIEARGSAPKGI